MLNILTFNCQYGYQKGFKNFITETISSQTYDFILLQEVDEKVLETLNPLTQEFNYSRVVAYSHKTGLPVSSYILYKPIFKFFQSNFLTFSPIVFQEIKDTGSLAAVFKLPMRHARFFGKKKIIITVTHLHGSYRLVARKRELMQMKRQVMSMDPDNRCVKIIGGDFNNLIKGEGRYNDIVMLPEFVNVTDFKDHTHDSKHLESHYINYPLAKMFFMRGKTYQSKLDHIYMDIDTADSINYVSGIIDVVASDHRPVELKIIK